MYVCVSVYIRKDLDVFIGYARVIAECASESIVNPPDRPTDRATERATRLFTVYFQRIRNKYAS